MEIHHWPRPEFDVFLSHAAEDRIKFIERVDRELSRHKIKSWYDQRDYPPGMDSIDTLQENLLRCHHIIYFVTASNVRQGRGWSAAERTLSSRINRLFHISSQRVHNFELPLFYVPYSHEETARSIWFPLRQFGPTCPHRLGTSQSIDWTISTIKRFTESQRNWRRSSLEIIENNRGLREQLNKYAGMFDWLKAPHFDPVR
jgi:hypothetical protein